MRAELEIAQGDGELPPVDRLIEDLREALELLGEVETATLAIVQVLVVDDDGRLAELTARGLRRLGFDAETAGRWRPLRPREIVVFDLGVSGSLSAAELAVLKGARPIVVTGAADPGSRALAENLDASDYLVKPVEVETLAASVRRRASA
jgi:DNA-binding response OmpR family regulator